MPEFLKKTRFEYIKGKFKYCRVVKPDIQYNCWACNIYPVPEDLEKIRGWQADGLKNQVKKDEDGWYTKFRCVVSRQRKDGTLWTFEPPKVIDANGAPMDGTAIGDGSDGTLKLEVYEHGTPGGGKAIAARLVGVRVENLVPFNPDKDYTADEYGEIKDLKDQPGLF